MKGCKDKIILITGASSGIGQATAERFAGMGAKLILCARRMERLNALAESLKKLYQTSCYLFSLDVCQRAAVEDFINSLPPEWQTIDVLVNNAGLAAGLDKFQEASLNDWEVMIDTNIKGVLYLTRSILPGMIARNHGHIINIASTAGHETYVGGNVYAATKHALLALTKSIKLDTTGHNIRVTAISPGMTVTEFSQVRFKGDEKRAAAVYKGMQPLSGEDVADAIAYAVNCPAHVNISEILLTPTDQSSVTVIARKDV